MTCNNVARADIVEEFLSVGGALRFFPCGGFLPLSASPALAPESATLFNWNKTRQLNSQRKRLALFLVDLQRRLWGSPQRDIP